MPGPPVPWSEDDLETSVGERFERQANAAPGALALKTREEAYTFSDLDRRANGLARAILEAGGDPALPVALLAERRTAAICALLAAFKAGRPSLYLDPSMPEQRLAALLDDSGADLVVGEGRALGRARPLAAGRGARLVDAGDRAGATGESPGIRVAPDAPAQLVYTSGSTGAPRGVVTSHRHLLWSCLPRDGDASIGPGDRLLLAASPGAGQALGVFLALLNGAAVFPFDVEAEGLTALRDRIAEEGITACHSVPSVFRSLVKTFRGDERFSRLRLVRLGGDTVRREDVALFRRHFRAPAVLRVGYGCTEAGPIAGHVLPADGELPGGPLPVGRPYEGAEVRLLDEEGREVAAGETGEIAVRSRYLALGYWRREELTRERFLPDPAGGPERTYRTGDLGRLRPDGLLVHLGRKDLQLQVRGNRVEAGEVEAALRSLPGVADAAVAAHPSPDGESRLVGYVAWEGRPGSARFLREGLSRTLPDHAVPSSFVFLPALPLTPSGKLDRAALGPPEARVAIAAGSSAARDGLERELAEIWEALLGTRPVGVRDDFFELGGDSLLAVELFAELERRTGRRLPLSAFAGASTVELLARRLRAPAPERWPCVVPLQPVGSRPAFYCASWAEGEVLAYAPLAARFSPHRPFLGLRRERLPDGRPRHRRVEAMAGQYVGELLDRQPEGPFCVGGLSGGAIVALEMARQLSAAGREVGALVLMEPPGVAGGRGERDRGARAPSRLADLVAKARLYPVKWRLLAPEEKRSELRRKGARLRRRLLPRAGEGALPPSPPLVGAHVGPDVVVKDVDLHDASPWDGKATLILASHEPFRRERIAFWRALVTGGLDVRVVPGLHAAILQEPFVRVLARVVEDVLPPGPR